jgi:quinolinate synthase
LSEQLLEKIERLRRDRKAVILAHNYQSPEVQDIADFTGDSLGLSIQAARTEAETIVFCGVKFMAETAAILSPDKTVLMPDKDAGCPMADMITAEQLRELKAENPGALVVCYVNSTVEVKAESDYCCTSANAVEVIRSLPADKAIIFVPDKNLGRHVENVTGRQMILWPGYCPTHVMIRAEDVKAAKVAHPRAKVLAHPECTEDVRKLADELLSTGQMLKFTAKGEGEYIIATETGILHSLRKQNPRSKFYAASERGICPNMKRITLEKVAWSLEERKYRITVDDNVAGRAKRALERMIEIVPA